MEAPPSYSSNSEEGNACATNERRLYPGFSTARGYRKRFLSNARPCLGATLKPKLCNRGFDEKSIGFRKFGDFLRAAEASGYVKLSKTIGGDIAIVPATTAGVPPSPPAVLAPSLSKTPTPLVPPTLIATNVPLRVRQDLWNAFNSIAGTWVYDPEKRYRLQGRHRRMEQHAPSST